MLRRWTASRTARVLGGGGVFAAVSAGLVAPGSALAATTCQAPPGTAAESVRIDEGGACGATSDGTAGAWSHGDGGVGFADARAGATVWAAGFGGGVGAGESTGGRLLTFGYGLGSLALGVLDGPGTALVAAGPQSQAYVGDADDPVLCQGDLAAAVNLDAGIGCVVVGEFRYVTPGAQTPMVAPARP